MTWRMGNKEIMSFITGSVEKLRDSQNEGSCLAAMVWKYVLGLGRLSVLGIQD